MIPITDHVNSTSSHLQVNLQFFRNEYESSENIIQELQEQIARTLAHKIVNQRKFFTLSLVDNIGVMKADVIVFTEKELDEKIKFNYESIAAISKGNRIYYYTLDGRGARQVNQFSTFHFKKNDKMILSDNGRYFMIQNTDKILHLYDARNKTLLKSMRTNEHKPFFGNAYFDLEKNEIVAVTKMGESRWNISGN